MIQFLFEPFLDKFNNEAFEVITIGLIRESIHEYALAFIAPELYKLVMFLDGQRSRAEDTLEDLGDISEIKEVVELRWDWQKVHIYAVEKFDCCLDSDVATFLNRCTKIVYTKELV